MNLRQLEIVKAITDTGSFTAASQQLNVAQSAISRQIRLLESECQQAIFSRIGHKVILTKAGQSLVQLAGRVFADIKETSLQIAGEQGSLSGSIHFGIEMPLGLYLFPSLLALLRRDHPLLEVTVTTVTTQAAIDRIRAGTIDMALVALPTVPTHLAVVPAVREELMVISAPSFRLGPRAVEPAELAGLPFIMPLPSVPFRRSIDTFCELAELRLKVVVETESVEFMAALVRRGLGVAIVPFSAVEQLERSGEIVTARIRSHVIVQESGWLYAPATPLPRFVSAVISASHACIADAPSAALQKRGRRRLRKKSR